MALLKVTQSSVQQILEMYDQEIDPVEIARSTGLRTTQVCAIIAHRKLSSTVDPSETPPPEFGRSVVNEYASHTQTELTAAPIENITVPLRTEEEATKISEQTAREGIFVGEDKDYGDPLYWNPEDAAAVQNPHLMIMGESGSGKTYAVQCLTAELSKRGIPSIIFDYGQGFELNTLDATFRKYTDPAEYRLGEEGIALNPLQIFPNDVHGPKSVAARVADIFDSVYHLGDIQRKVLIEAILRAFNKAGISADLRGSWGRPAPSLDALQEILDELASDKEYPNAKNAVGLAARLTTFFMLSSFRTDAAGWSWGSLLDDSRHLVHILQFRGLEGKTQRVLVEALLWHLFFYLKSHGQAKLRLYCILDEAHHLSFREGGPVDLLLREARKFGLGIIFASQQPEDFSPAAFSNSASKLVFQTADPNLKVSRFLAAKCSNYDSPEQIHDVIAVLQQGDAFFITRNRGYKVRIADLRQRAALWSEK